MNLRVLFLLPTIAAFCSPLPQWLLGSWNPISTDIPLASAQPPCPWSLLYVAVQHCGWANCELTPLHPLRVWSWDCFPLAQMKKQTEQMGGKG